MHATPLYAYGYNNLLRCETYPTNLAPSVNCKEFQLYQYYQKNQEHSILSEIFSRYPLDTYHSGIIYYAYLKLFFNSLFDIVKEIIESNTNIGSIENVIICLHAIRTNQYDIVQRLKYLNFPFNENLMCFDFTRNYPHSRVGINALCHASHYNNLPMCKFLIEECDMVPFNKYISLSQPVNYPNVFLYDMILYEAHEYEDIFDYFLQFDIPQKNLSVILIHCFGSMDISKITKIIDRGIDFNEIDPNLLIRYGGYHGIKYIIPLGLVPNSAHMSAACYHQNLDLIDLLLDYDLIPSNNDLLDLFSDKTNIPEILNVLNRHNVDMSKLVLPNHDNKRLILNRAEDLGLDTRMLLLYLI